jgi:signal transduction histidine kinase/ligand-binding sensor domain-containing protein
LAHFVGGRWQILGPEWGLPNSGVRIALPARDGTLWVESKDQIFLLRPGAHKFEATGQRYSGTTLVEGADGRIWSTAGWAPKSSPWLVAVPNFAKTPQAHAERKLDSPTSPLQDFRSILVDRDNSFWTTTSQGVLRAPGNQRQFTSTPSDRFSLSNGLTSDLAGPILEDREGDIWVGTALGLDRFRAADAVPAAGIPLASQLGFWASAADKGQMYIATGDKLYAAAPDRNARLIALRAPRSAFLFTDTKRRLWVGGNDNLSLLVNGRLKRQDLPAAAKGDPVFIDEDNHGALWITVWANGVFRKLGRTWRRVTTPQPSSQAAPDQVVADAAGHIWMRFHGAVWSFEGGRLRHYDERDGLGVRHVELIVGAPNETLVAGDFGLARYKNGRFQTITSEMVPDFLRISGVVESSRGDAWINGMSGVVRVRTQDLDWAFDHPTAPLTYRLFTLADGLPGVAEQDHNTPTAVEAADGKIWLVTNHGVAWIDPAKLVHNPLPPPVTIRALLSGGQTFTPQPRLDLPPGSAALQIDYTALSLVAPERVRFRYRLDGVDRNWIEPGARRQAFYTNLGAGRYTFHVIAANNDGVWNTKGADIQFTIKPTFVQSVWFLLLCLAAGVLVLSGAYFARLRQVTDRMEAQLDARLAERERIARELHDTLLQGFHGLVLRFQAVADSIPAKGSARGLMNDALRRADRVLVEGRERILDLRSADHALALPEAVNRIADKIGLSATLEFGVSVEGEPRPLTPNASSEICKFCEEALFNTYRHSNAQSAHVFVIYRHRELRVLVCDDGIGISPEVIAKRGKSGHYGLAGMHERAHALHADLVIGPRKGGGVELSFAVPRKFAYAASNRGERWRRWLHGMLLNKEKP